MISPLIVDSLKVSLQAPGHIKSKVCDVKDFVRMSANGIVEPEEVLYVSCSPSHLLSALGAYARSQAGPGLIIIRPFFCRCNKTKLFIFQR